MSIESVAWALNVLVGDPLAKLVLIALANHNSPENLCIPSRKTIAHYCECSLDTVDRKIAYLCQRGLLVKKTRKASNGDNTSNAYYLNAAYLIGEAHTAATLAAQSGHLAAELCGSNHKVKNEPPDGGSRARGRQSRIPTSEPALRIAKLFSRKEITPWAEKEIKSFKKLVPIDLNDLSLVESYYAAERAKGGDGIHRRDLYTFLNNYHGELDRARAWKENPSCNENTRKAPNNRPTLTASSANAGTSNASVASRY